MAERKEFKYALVKPPEGIECIFDEKGNTVLKMATVSWNDRPAKLELRKWIINGDGEVRANKGFSFLTEDGPNELAHCLLREGFGDNKTIKEIMGSRDVNIDVEIPEEEDDTESVYYDPKELLGG